MRATHKKPDTITTEQWDDLMEIHHLATAILHLAGNDLADPRRPSIGFLATLIIDRAEKLQKGVDVAGQDKAAA